MSDLTILTDEDLNDMVSDAKAELSRRKKEKKLPVYAVDHCYHKSAEDALDEMAKHVAYVRNFKGGPEAFFRGAIDDQVNVTKLGLRIEFWSESEYQNRPDKVWGASF